MPNRATWIMGCSVGLLAALIAFTPLWNRPEPPKSPRETPYANALAISPPSHVQNGELLRIRFISPGSLASEPSQSAVPPRLLGLVEIGRQRWAYLAAASKPPVKAIVGDQIDGWKVVAIGASSVVLVGDGDPVTLRPFEQSKLEKTGP